MAFPVVEGVVTGASGSTSTTSHVITFPSNIQVGDILVVFFASDGDQNTSVSSGSGWTKLLEQDRNNEVTLSVYWKAASGSGDNLTLGTGSTGSNWISYRVSGAVNVLGSMTTGDSSSPNPPTHSRSTTRDYLWFAGAARRGNVAPSSAPTGYQNLQSRSGSTGNRPPIGSAQRNITTSSENPGSFSVSGGDPTEWVAATLSVTPAAQADASIIAKGLFQASGLLGKGASAFLEDDDSFLTSKRSRAKNISPALIGKAFLAGTGVRGKNASASISGEGLFADSDASRARGRFAFISGSAAFAGGEADKFYGGTLVGQASIQLVARPAEKAELKAFAYLLPPILEFHRHRAVSVSASSSMVILPERTVGADAVNMAMSSLSCRGTALGRADVSAVATFSTVANRFAPALADIVASALLISDGSRGVLADSSLTAIGVTAADPLTYRRAQAQLLGSATQTAAVFRIVTTRFAKVKGLSSTQGLAVRRRQIFAPLIRGRGIVQAKPSAARATFASTSASSRLTAIKRAAIRGVLSGFSGTAQISGKTFIKLSVPASLQAIASIAAIPTPTHPGGAAVTADASVAALAATKRGAKAFVNVFADIDPVAHVRRRSKAVLIAGGQLSAQKNMIEAALFKLFRATAFISISAKANRIRSAQLHGHRSKATADADLIGGRDAIFLAQCFVDLQAVAVRAAATAVSSDADVAATASLGVNVLADVSANASSDALAVALRRTGIFLFSGTGAIQATSVRAGTGKGNLLGTAATGISAVARNPSAAVFPGMSSCIAKPNRAVARFSEMSAFAQMVSFKNMYRGAKSQVVGLADLDIATNSIRSVEGSLVAQCTINAGWGGEVANVKFDVV